MRRGLTIFFTGLSGAGKSTLATRLAERLRERGRDDVTLLDGDEVRKLLSSDLGFSKEHRDLNIRRVGFVAQAVTRSGGIAICAAIAPYEETRSAVRTMVSEAGAFVLVYVSTPIGVCERRDPKGLYARARTGAIPYFTGVSDPYEVPRDAEITLDTSVMSAEGSVEAIVAWLERQGLLAPAASV